MTTAHLDIPCQVKPAGHRSIPLCPASHPVRRCQGLRAGQDRRQQRRVESFCTEELQTVTKNVHRATERVLYLFVSNDSHDDGRIPRVLFRNRMCCLTSSFASGSEALFSITGGFGCERERQITVQQAWNTGKKLQYTMSVTTTSMIKEFAWAHYRIKVWHYDYVTVRCMCPLPPFKINVCQKQFQLESTRRPMMPGGGGSKYNSKISEIRQTEFGHAAGKNPQLKMKNSIIWRK